MLHNAPLLRAAIGLPGGNDIFTKLLLHCDGAAGSTIFLDSAFGAVPHVMTANGNAQVDTARSVFGGCAFLSDGTSDYLTSPNSADWDLGTAGAGDFTIDFWVNFNSTTGQQGLMGADNGVGTTGWEILVSAGGNFLIVTQNSTVFNTAWSRSTNIWYHVAIVRRGAVITVYINGTSLGTATDGSWQSGANGLIIGTGNTGLVQGFINGWMDEIRISKGVARWTSAFIPPTRRYF